MLREPRRISARELLGVTPQGVHAAFPSAKALASAAQSVANSTWTKIVLATTGGVSTWEGWDNDEMFDNANDRLVFKHEGLYLVVGGLFWVTNGIGARYIGIQMNGAFVASQQQGPAVGQGPRGTITVPVTVDRNDYVELFGWQDSGGNLNTSVSEGMPFLSAVWVGVPS